MNNDNNIIINSDAGTEESNKIDKKAMDAMLGLLSDEAYFQQQQNQQRPKFKSGSMQQIDKNRNVCSRCNGLHSPLECPFTTKNLLAPSN